MKNHIVSILLILHALCSYGGIKNDTVYANIKKDLLSDPVKLHERNQKVFNDFVKKIEEQEIFLAKNIAMIEDIEKESPIFTITECDELCCILTRNINPKLRKVAEEKIVALFDQKITEKKKEPIHCVSFGSGGLFQELVVFTKALSKHPESQLVIHMIDGVYENMGNPQAQPADEKTRYAENLSFFMQRMFMQFTNSLKFMFPKSKVTVYNHPYIDDYFNFLEKEKMSHADIVFGIDIGMYPVNGRDPINDYIHLCMKTMQKNSSYLNILLFNRYIYQFFLEDGVGRIKMPFNLKNNKEFALYCAVIHIPKIKKNN